MKQEQSSTGASAALFFVPTVDLVSQQKKALKLWIGDDYEVADYYGGKAVPSTRFDVLVSTPQAFLVSIYCLTVSL